MGRPRRTQARLDIAIELLRHRTSTHWCYELSRRSGVGPGSMYPFLTELLEAGHLTAGWEDAADVPGRPPRRYYHLTPEGEQFLLEFVGSEAEKTRASRPAIAFRPRTALP